MGTERVLLQGATYNFEIDILVWEGFQKLANPTYRISHNLAIGCTIFVRFNLPVTYYKPDIFGCLEGENIFKKLFLNIFEWSFKLSQNDFNCEKGTSY
jgi:hypothetical protein